ncbi:hypothetical protein FQR65_LT19356 [Abscondita terminalis]|nr:hypothetical protein FQR65_LT19356 [Abscondita terminalis]
MDKIQLDTIPEAIEHLRKGKMIVVVDDEDRENEGDLIGAADLVTPEMINFMTVHARGLVCVPLPEKRCDELGLDIMIHYGITKGKWADKEPVLIRVQSSSAYFDIFTRLANGEKPLMEKAIRMINDEGKGAIVFINNVSDSEKTMNKLQQFLAYQSGTQNKPTVRAQFKDYGNRQSRF